jgi:O-antigen/teichoic acid export membrane protein
MFKNFIHYLGPQLLRSFSAIFITLPITTFYLNIEDFGLYALLTAFINIGVIFCTSGSLSLISSKYFLINKQKKFELILNHILIEITLKIIFLVLFLFFLNYYTPFFLKKYVDDSFYFYIQILLLTSLFTTFWPTTSYLLVISKKANSHAFIEYIQIITNIVAIIILLTYFNLGALSLYLSPLISALISFLLELFILKNMIAGKINFLTIKNLIKSGLPSVPARIIETTSNSIDRLIVEKYLSVGMLGIYSHSLNYLSLFKSISKAFGRVINPTEMKNMSIGFENNVKLKQMIITWQFFISLIGAIVILFIYEILKIITNDKFTQAAPLIMIWLYFLTTQTLATTHLQFLIFKMQYKLIASIQILFNLITILLVLIFIIEFGIIGAAIAILIGNFFNQILIIIFAYRLGFRFNGYKYSAISFLSFSIIIALVELIKINLNIKIFILILTLSVLIIYVLLYKKNILRTIYNIKY